MFTKLRALFLSVTFILQSSLVFIYSQQTDFVAGKIINSGTNEPVPFATILLKDNQLGVYANADGDFKVLNNPEFRTDSLIITCIGFKRYSMAFSHFSNNPENTIFLKPIIYGLGEVKIISTGKKLGSLAIIGRAIRNIPRNYPERPFNYISYYRDYQKRDGKYINLNEAIVQTLDKGFTLGSLFNSYRLLDFKKNLDFPRINISPYYENGSEGPDEQVKSIPDATIGDQYGNELFVLMTHDAIRNFKTRSFSFIEVFSEDFIHNHNFAEPVAVYDNNLLLYKIMFNGKTKVIGNSFIINGAIYIQPKTYSIHKIEYSCSYEADGRRLGEMFNADIEYGQENDVDSLMCLKYISFNNFFKVVDMDDSTYFRSLKAYWETNLYLNPTLVVVFNNKIDPVSGSEKENYLVTIGTKKLKITSVQIRQNTAYIRTKEEYIKRPGDSSYIYVQNLKDIDGKMVNKKKTIDLYQYRELFVQEYNKPLVLKDSCLMEYHPLEQNCRSSYAGNEKYWMNTPVNIKITDN